MKNQSLITKLKAKGFKLNQQQAEAVADLDGISIIQAAPGTGKTNLLAAKIMNICMNDSGASVLAISFTKKSVIELQSRVLGNSNVTVSTLHSWFYRIIRMDFGYKTFSFIRNESERKTLLRKAIYDAKLEEAITIEELSSALAKGVFSTEELKTAGEMYLEILKQHHLMCFDALQFFTLELLQNCPTLAKSVAKSIDYLLVDESQDLSRIQLKIILEILKPGQNNNLTFIGDPNQTIFSFRGAESLAMDIIYGTYALPNVKCKDYRLDVNYRSCQQILDIAPRILKGSPVMTAARQDNGSVTFKACNTVSAEASYIIDEIQKLHSEGLRYKDIAVLFRSSHVSDILFEEMMNRGLPVVKVGSDSLRINNSRFKCLLSLLAMVYDPNHSWFYAKCALPVLGISPKIVSHITSSETSLNDRSLKDMLLSIPSMSKSQKSRLFDFFAMDVKAMTFFQVIDTLWNQYLKDYFKAEDDNRIILEELYDIIGDCRSFEELRDYVFRIRKQCKLMEKLRVDPNADFVTLSSIHSAKGLEYPVTFIIGAYDGSMPSLKAENREEENRLAFVAATRAKDKLYVTYPMKAKNGENNAPSPYFAELFKENK